MVRQTKSESSTRASVTFPAEVYASLEIIAKQKKVSMAWVVRDAAEKYVAEQWPLFARTDFAA
jgi:metal-responsive CopG/Arc/MetJ family transcriptional regulator